ncbi:chloramphenicol-sensitive protein RarD [Evansella vedderi]|uniref:Chloramphenicol-sensitive protein RarD n=1 Tax=Evansella vedderi TaxID=38282 RepID=A0ABT9ZVA3_9BACI|nr:EamA family transporter RarD [Evansella vedderi]MDQ0255171.1 chloramphenicol-sensitive protein RarD [Evansella vedderi]
MSDNTTNSLKWGILSGVGAYILWGALPIYWKMLDHVPSVEVLAHRVIWSCIFMIILLSFLRKSRDFMRDIQKMFQQPKILIGMICAALLISLNWGTYIWAVTNDFVLETSFGYYINPLVSVVLGVIFLKERLSRMQWFSVGLAALAVTILTVSLGSFPLVALTLALSFALYGLAKKLVDVGAMSSVAIEAMLVIPLAVGFLIFQHGLSSSMFYVDYSFTFWLLVGAGAATALPLMLFTAGAKRIPLSLIGFLQYIAPTMMLFLGVFLYGEAFTSVHLVAFSMIWAALVIFTVSRFRLARKMKAHAVEVAELPKTLRENKAKASV